MSFNIKVVESPQAKQAANAKKKKKNSANMTVNAGDDRVS